MSLTHKIVLAILTAGGLAVLTLALVSVGRSAAPTPRSSLRLARGDLDGSEFSSSYSSLPQRPREATAAEGRTGSIAGTVADPSGVPAADADISAITFDGRPTIGGTTRSRADGTFLLSALAPGAYTVTAQRAGVGHAVREQVTVEADRSTTMEPLLLRAGTLLPLLLLDPDRKPAAGATVRIDSIFSRPDRSSYAVLFGELKTDSIGRVTIDALPDGRYQLGIVPAAGHREAHSFEVEDRVLIARFLPRPGRAPSGGARVEFELQDGRGLSLQGAQVHLYRVEPRGGRLSFGLRVAEGFSDARGRASFTALPDSLYAAVLIAPGSDPVVDWLEVRNARCLSPLPIVRRLGRP